MDRRLGLNGRIRLILLVLGVGFIPTRIEGNADAKKLYTELLSNYNKLIRPVGNNSDRLTVRLGLKLSQLIEVNLKSQIMTTNMWLEQEWSDYKLTWNPEDFGGVETLHVPSEHIWLPDIVLYNNADGNYEVTIMTKALLNYTGIVRWKPPAIYKSHCEIDVEYFPFDYQTCRMKFGSWTYDGYTVDLRHIQNRGDKESADDTEIGIDLQDYYISVEWDIMQVPAKRSEKYYSCCDEPYIDIIFSIVLRRKTLYYNVNLIIPCVGISFLSVLVFYLPSDSGEKMSLCISILLSLTVFILLLAEIIPPTSLAVPLLGKYLLFTMTLITFSVIVTICILNVNYRSPATHKMSPWVKTVFIQVLPKYLCLRRPPKDEEDDELQHSHGLLVTSSGGCGGGGPFGRTTGGGGGGSSLQICHIHGLNHTGGSPVECGTTDFSHYPNLPSPIFVSESEATLRHNFGALLKHVPPEIEKSATHARFVAQHMKNKDRFAVIEEDWKYVAMVLDRLFLWIFTTACVVGTATIIIQAPSLYDTSRPIDVQYSKIAKAKMMQMEPEEE